MTVRDGVRSSSLVRYSPFPAALSARRSREPIAYLCVSKYDTGALVQGKGVGKEHFGEWKSLVDSRTVT